MKTALIILLIITNTIFIPACSGKKTHQLQPVEKRIDAVSEPEKAEIYVQDDPQGTSHTFIIQNNVTSVKPLKRQLKNPFSTYLENYSQLDNPNN
jgi:hypothetical protein